MILMGTMLKLKTLFLRSPSQVKAVLVISKMGKLVFRQERITLMCFI